MICFALLDVIGGEPKHPGDPSPYHFLPVSAATIFDQSPCAVNATNDENRKKISIHGPPLLFQAAARLLFLA